MRALFGWLAVFLGAISIALAARYGYKGADTEVDGVISTVVFGSIALCAYIFDAAAVRLWFMGHRLGAIVIGAIAALALVVTFTNSLGAIAGRADMTLAERTKAADARKDDRAEMKRLQAALAAIGKYTPTDEAAVAAAKRFADTATNNRTAECDKRGPLCKQRELDEAGAATSLATTTTAKATSDRAVKLEADIRAVRKRLDGGEAVTNPNPLGTALELMLGAGAAALTAWQQAIVAAVFELCLVGVMVIFELLGQGQKQSAARGEDKAPERLPPHVTPNSSSKTYVRKKPSYGSVKTFASTHLFPADGERLDIKSLIETYRAWCSERNLTPFDLEKFLDEVEELCRKLGIRIEADDKRRVYCYGVKIDAPGPASVH